MSRLLFAAARGARIEHITSKGWAGSSEVDTCELFGRFQRIHPDDAHLQYGPISTALRESAQNPPIDLDKALPEDGEFSLNSEINTWILFQQRDEHHRSLFLLILAEALADEGL